LGYIRRLCADLSGILEREIEVSGQEAMIPTTYVQPIGLVVNELVTNAAKHGAGKIKVAFDRRDGGYSLSVRDEGDGLPVGFDPLDTANGLGMKVVIALATQLGGSVIAKPNLEGSGSCFTVSFSTSQTAQNA
jgi:two-component sensor histidine kinase